MKIKIQIKHWVTGAVLFEFEKENNTIKDTLIEANLYGVNLRGANLYGADLYGVNLRGADLRGAKNINGDYTDFWWHVHHEILVEQLTEPLRTRINYIKNNKPKNEVKLRLKLLRPVLGDIPTDQKGWEKLHKKECLKSCPWNSKQSTIFPMKP